MACCRLPTRKPAAAGANWAMMLRMRTAPHPSVETISDDLGPAQWLDALAEGTCSQDDFVERVLQRESTDPEVTWEVRALLDQNFRRKRLDRETFVCLKARLHRHSLGVHEDGGGDASSAKAARPLTGQS